MADQSSRAESTNVRASLGCGTLILIAIIVAMFSGRSETDDLRNEVRELRTQVERLEAKIDSLSVRLPPAPTP
jgi:hypothetical protein